MRKIFLFISIFLLFSSNLVMAAEISEADWLSDLNYLESELPVEHYNLFFKLEKEEFIKEMDKLKNDLPELSNLDTTLRLAEIFAKIGDTHTAIDNTRFLTEYYPLFLKKFEDGYRVIMTDNQYKKILGAKLIAINNYSIEELKDHFNKIITADNQISIDYRISSFLKLNEVLKYLGIVDSKNEFLFEKDGEKIRINFEPLKIKNMASSNNSLSKLDYQTGYIRSNANQLFWSDYIAAEKMVYFQYNSCWSRELAQKHGKPNSELPSFAAEESEILNYIKNKEIDKLVIDLRFNSGGDSSQGTELAEKLSKYRDQFETYIIIGADTFSSAIINALDFKKQLDGYLIGTATMGKPNHYGEVRTFNLPNTGLRVSYSTNYFKLLENSDPDSLYPDITVETKFEDFLSGRDSILEIIKNID
ncbi:S41 family peptidase [Halanaerobium sp. ST460_2HS_T2]|uniref:S41 family peptidase n=1 Tax=Halanaerobium sp. ST460_2HS_T2 TaxID=2183914 RepID=UPI000DF31FB8|nr:S41 family peptidase [Halanaerobium sp. ST460_2HS_T2]RCW58718.1 peptidase S41-like protein [Halanaerobium sp. ST460_2HS_T2]